MYQPILLSIASHLILQQGYRNCDTTSDALAKMGLEHGPTSKVMSKLHEHSRILS